METRAIRLSAGVVIVRPAVPGLEYLLLRAYAYWDFPKGLVEAGEDPLGAARREVEEETTLTDLRFTWGEGYFETPPYGPGKIARYYLAETLGGTVSLPVSLELGRPEHDEFRWLTYEAAVALLSPRVGEVIAWAREIIGRTSA